MSFGFFLTDVLTASRHAAAKSPGAGLYQLSSPVGSPARWGAPPHSSRFAPRRRAGGDRGQAPPARGRRRRRRARRGSRVRAALGQLHRDRRDDRCGPQTTTAGNIFANPGAIIAGNVVTMALIVRRRPSWPIAWRPTLVGVTVLAGALVPRRAQVLRDPCPVDPRRSATSALPQPRRPRARSASARLTTPVGSTSTARSSPGPRRAGGLDRVQRTSGEGDGPERRCREPQRRRRAHLANGQYALSSRTAHGLASAPEPGATARPRVAGGGERGIEVTPYRSSI